MAGRQDSAYSLYLHPWQQGLRGKAIEGAREETLEDDTKHELELTGGGRKEEMRGHLARLRYDQ